MKVARDLFDREPATDVVYSTFEVIDEVGRSVPVAELIDGLRTILTDLDTRPLTGADVWTTLAVERDTLTIPSALNVRTALASLVPFPPQWRFHEDTHTWLRYSASGAVVAYTPDIPSKYRVPRETTGSESRQRAGGIEAFNRLRAKVISEGLAEAVELGVTRAVVTPEQGLVIRVRYLLSVAQMVQREGTPGVAEELRDWARTLSDEAYRSYAERYGAALPVG